MAATAGTLGIAGLALPAYAAGPGAPTGVHAIPQDTQAFVSWTPTGDAAMHYTVTPHDLTTSQTLDGVTAGGSQTGRTVTGLTNGDAYTFTVTATDDDGSASAESSQPVTPTHLASPSSVEGFVGFGPRAIALSPDRSTAFVANSYDDTLAVVDTATGALTGSIDLSDSDYLAQVAVSPAGPGGGYAVYVLTGEAVLVIDSADLAADESATGPMDPPSILLHTEYPVGLAVARDGTVYALSEAPAGASFDDYPDGVVSVIAPADLPADEQGATLPTVTAGLYSAGIAVSPDGDTVYVTNAAGDNGEDGSVSVIDTTDPSDPASDPVTTVDLGPTASPYAVAVSPDGATAYVTGAGGLLWAIDTAQDTAGDPIPVTDPGHGAGALLVDGDTVYVVDPGNFEAGENGAVVMLDTADLDSYTSTSPPPTVPVDGSQLSGIAISADGRTVYVTDQGDSTLRMLDTDTRTFVGGSGVLPVQSSAHSIALSPDGTTAYVAADRSGRGEIDVFDTATDALRGRLPICADPDGSLYDVSIALSPDGGTLYIGDRCLTEIDSYAIAVVEIADLSSYEASDAHPDGVAPPAISVGMDPDQLVVSPDGDTLYAEGAVGDGAISAIDTDELAADLRDDTGDAIGDATTLDLSAEIGEDVNGMELSPDDGMLYVAGNSALAVVDTATLAAEADEPSTVPVIAGDPHSDYFAGVAVSPDGGTLYVTDADAPDDAVGVGSLWAIDTQELGSYEGDTPTASPTVVHVGKDPGAVAVSPDSRTVYVANGFHDETGTVSTIDAATDQPTGVVHVGVGPQELAVSPDGAAVYVADDDSSDMVITSPTPWPPTGVTASAGDGRATVSWTAPAFGGHLPIDGYTVTPTDIMASETLPGTTVGAGRTSATITGLTDGHAYTFTVTAHNVLGSGLASAASAPATPTAPPPPATVPTAPTNVTATAGDGQATVSWAAPASDGGAAITGYTVTASPGGATVQASGTSTTVTGLSDGTAYTFTVTATNRVGTSAASAPSAAVTPVAPPVDTGGGPSGPSSGNPPGGGGSTTPAPVVSKPAPVASGKPAAATVTHVKPGTKVVVKGAGGKVVAKVAVGAHGSAKVSIPTKGLKPGRHTFTVTYVNAAGETRHKTIVVKVKAKPRKPHGH